MQCPGAELCNQMSHQRAVQVGDPTPSVFGSFYSPQVLRSAAENAHPDEKKVAITGILSVISQINICHHGTESHYQGKKKFHRAAAVVTRLVVRQEE